MLVLSLGSTVHRLLFICDLVKNMERWKFFVDTGGTFTDCLGLSPDGEVIRAKVLSRGTLSAHVLEISGTNKVRISVNDDWPINFPVGFSLCLKSSQRGNKLITGWNPSSCELEIDHLVPEEEEEILGAIELESGWEAPVLGMRLILARCGRNWRDVDAEMKLATTRCTNALLEGTGTLPVLFITAGFADLLEIGDQRRTDLFDLVPRKCKKIQGDVVEVRQRIDRSGKILKSLDYKELEEQASLMYSKGNRTAVVSFIHSWANNKHEIEMAEILIRAGFENVISSSAISSFPKWLPRTESASVEAFLSTTLNQYLDNVKTSLGTHPKLWVMGSAGGLIKRKYYRAIDSLLSGPAAGVVGAGVVARSCGMKKFINLDMGGTSSDVSRYSGNYSYQSPHQVGDAQISSVALKIETVASGGGSICRVENGLLRVGPESAGAHPGPACYGFGGPFCLTDVNLLLGRLSSQHFSTPIFPRASGIRLQEMVESSGRDADELLQGFLVIANDSMANAIRKISIQQGYDPSDHALVAFGGAGGQHACGVADLLGMSRVILPAEAGLLSAYGLSQARVERLIEHPVLLPLDCSSINDVEKQMIEKGILELKEMGEVGQLVEKRAFIRRVGQDSALEIIYEDPQELESKYRKKFEQIFGYIPKVLSLELHSLRIQIAVPASDPSRETFPNPIHFDLIKPSQEIDRATLSSSEIYGGPLLVTDTYSTLWVGSDWTVRVGSKGTLLLEKFTTQESPEDTAPLMARRELFSNRFLCLAEEMGSQLQRTALSTNIRERLDFSCALLDKKGYLVANAPHIPVHLGAMGIFTRSLLREFPTLTKGDILVSNHPAYGGSHLPDVSVLAPVFGRGEEPVCFLANRAHHAEIGGVSPGSMPAGSAILVEEGVVLAPQYLVKQGQSQMNKITDILKSATFPSRQIDENLADLSAQVASLRHGIESMENFFSTYGEVEVCQQMEALREASNKSCKRYLLSLGKIKLFGQQSLDDNDFLRVAITIEKGKAVFDFTGTASTRSDNLNATEAIVYSAVCYSLRVLIGSNLPLNEGLLDPVEIILPEGTLLNPSFDPDPNHYPGVAGGNVEISQRLVDLILSSAFQEVACSQGTMNNITFGNQNFSHYETLAGGSGAIVGKEGTSAVQVHMTNTAITDPEILETRFPVRLLSFRRRIGSGGSGAWSGGAGVERVYLFEEEAEVSVLTQSRIQRPDGIAGGKSGECGEQILIRADGRKEHLSSLDRKTVYPGDRVVVRTPGGGGAGETLLIA